MKRSVIVLLFLVCSLLLSSYVIAEDCVINYTSKVCKYPITWGDETTTNQAPVTDTEINITGADLVCVQYNSTHANNTSTNWDLNFIFSQTLGGTYDDGTVPYVAFTGLGDNIIATPDCVGPLPHNYMKLRQDVNVGTGRLSVGVSVIYKIK